MRGPAILFFVLVALFGAACNSSSPGGGPALPWAAPAPPRPCPTCQGSGAITQSFNAPLPVRVDCNDCDGRATGFLGLGEGRVDCNVVVHNDGDQGGMFNVSMNKRLPGQADSAAVLVKQHDVWVAPHRSATKRFTFRPRELENVDIHCVARPPVVVQQRREVCPTCGGRGVVQ